MQISVIAIALVIPFLSTMKLPARWISLAILMGSRSPSGHHVTVEGSLSRRTQYLLYFPSAVIAVRKTSFVVSLGACAREQGKVRHSTSNRAMAPGKTLLNFRVLTL